MKLLERLGISGGSSSLLNSTNNSPNQKNTRYMMEYDDSTCDTTLRISVRNEQRSLFNSSSKSDYRLIEKIKEFENEKSSLL
jgi:hypothetical protein